MAGKAAALPSTHVSDAPDVPESRENGYLMVAAVAVAIVFFASVVGLVLVTRAKDRAETRLLSGTFTLFADDLNKSCIGPPGYDDINARTPVIVKNPQGHTVAQDALTEGTLVRSMSACRYTFQIPVPIGSSSYTVFIGKHGQATVSWADIDLPCAIDISVGTAGNEAGVTTCRPSAIVRFLAPETGAAGREGNLDDDPGWYESITLGIAAPVPGKRLWLLRRDDGGNTWVEDRLNAKAGDQTVGSVYLFGPDDRGDHTTLLVAAVTSSTDRRYQDARRTPIPSPVSMRGTTVLASRAFVCCAG